MSDLNDVQVDKINSSMRSQLMVCIRDEIDLRDLSQAKAGELLGLRQGDISNIYNLKYERMRLDKLINISNKLGLNIGLDLG